MVDWLCQWKITPLLPVLVMLLLKTNNNRGVQVDYGKERLVELLLAIDEEATLALGENSERYPS